MTSYVRSPTRPWRRGLDMVVLLDAEGETVVLRGGAVLAWDLLDEPRSLSELADELASLSAGDPGLIMAELAPVLARLHGDGALDVVVP